MSSTTTIPTAMVPATAEALAELDAAASDVRAAEADVEAITAAIEAGTVTDPDELVQADTRRRFAILRRKGAQARAEAARAAERTAALDALDVAVSAFDGPARLRAAEHAFAASVEAAAAVYAGVVAQVTSDAATLLHQARGAGVEAYAEPLPEGWHISGQGLHRRPHTGVAVATPYPVGHGHVERARLKDATEAYRRGVQKGGK
jgi:hypothetical protein